jgi:hypothetical protein
MPGIARELAEHALNVDPKAKSVQHTLHRFRSQGTRPSKKKLIDSARLDSSANSRKPSG